MAIFACRKGGIVLQVGLGNPTGTMAWLEIVRKELTVQGVIRYLPNCFQDAIDLVERGLVDLKSIITHAFTFEDSVAAFNTVKDGRRGSELAGKVVILNEKFVTDAADYVTARRERSANTL